MEVGAHFLDVQVQFTTDVIITVDHFEVRRCKCSKNSGINIRALGSLWMLAFQWCECNKSGGVREVGGLDSTRRLVESDLAFCLVRGVICQYSMKTCRVETKLLRDPGPYAWLLPESGTFNILAGVAWILSRARFLEHATPDAGTSLANFLHFFAPRIREASSDFGLRRLLVHAEVGSEVSVCVWVHGDGPRMGRCFVDEIMLRHDVVFALVLQHWV